MAVVAVARKLAELVWVLLTRSQDYTHSMPRLTDAKRALVRQQAREAGVPGSKGRTSAVEGRSPLYGLGLEQRGRTVKNTVARRAAEHAERLYVEMVAARGRGEAPAKEVGFDPTRPHLPDWQKVLEIAAASLTRTESGGKAAAAKASSGAASQ